MGSVFGAQDVEEIFQADCCFMSQSSIKDEFTLA